MSFVTELKRRNVFKVAVAYVIVGWIALQAASMILPIFEAPNWILQVFTFFVILGFPIAMILAWAFELTPEGIKPTAAATIEADVERLTSPPHGFCHYRTAGCRTGFCCCR